MVHRSRAAQHDASVGEPGSPSETVRRPAPAERSLRVNISWTMLGNLVYAATQWGSLAVLARLGTPETVGEFTAAVAITAPIVLFSNLQLRAVQATDARQENTFGEFFALRITTAALAFATIAAIGLSGWLSSTAAVLVLLVGLTKIVESFCDLCYGLFQKQERMDLVARSFLLRGPLGLLGLTLGTALTGDLAWGVTGMLAAWGATLTLSDAPRLVRLLRQVPQEQTWPVWNLPRLANLAWVALPIGLVSAVVSLQTNIPRYFVDYHLGKHDLGLYAAMAYVLVLGTTICNAVNQTALPRMARLIAEGELRAFRRLLLRLVCVGGGIGLAGVAVAAVAGSELMALLYGPAHANHPSTLLILTLAGALRYATNPVASAVRATRRFWPNFACNCLGLVVLSVACVVLVPAMGMDGAAWAIVASYTFDAAMYPALLNWALSQSQMPKEDAEAPAAAGESSLPVAA